MPRAWKVWWWEGTVALFCLLRFSQRHKKQGDQMREEHIGRYQEGTGLCRGMEGSLPRLLTVWLASELFIFFF